MNELALFAGAGGGILGGILNGWRTICAVEIDPYARDVLVARQNDGCLPPFPIWDDIRTFDGRPWRGLVDVVSGGFPCQDISIAGRGAGIEGSRSGLWAEMARIIGEVRPRFILVENSPMLVGRGLAVVLGDLAAMGFDARWGVVGARHAGAPHRRDRIWIVANAANADDTASCNKNRCFERPQAQLGRNSRFSRDENVADATIKGLEGHRHGTTLTDARSEQGHIGATPGEVGAWWEAEPGMGRVAHGVAHGVDRLRCLGNGQVPAVVPVAWSEMT